MQHITYNNHAFKFIYQQQSTITIEQQISQAYAPSPLTLRDCLVDGQIDLTRYRLCTRRVYDSEYSDLLIFNTKKR